MSQTLLDRIAQRKAHVGVIGQGYVGLPLALVFQEAGFTVTGALKMQLESEAQSAVLPCFVFAVGTIADCVVASACRNPS